MTCPVCGGTIDRLPNDPFNRFACSTETCWFHSNPVPHDVARAIDFCPLDNAQDGCLTCRSGALPSRMPPCNECPAPTYPKWEGVRTT